VDLGALDHAAVEAAMRTRVGRAKGAGAWAYRALQGTAEYTPGNRAASMAVVEDLDAPGQCESVATAAAQRFGLDVVCGWVLIGETVEDAELYQHFWNRDREGRTIDGALARHRPIGYLGKLMDERSAAMLGRLSFLDRGPLARIG
jgi:cyanophycinase-like exopeptidase